MNNKKSYKWIQEVIFGNLSKKPQANEHYAID